MTDPTQDVPLEMPSWQLTLEHGDRIAIKPAADETDPEAKSQIVLTMEPYRASELGAILDRYNRLAKIFQERSDIWTEESLSRGLRDAAAVEARPIGPVPATKVGAARRGMAMVILQDARPELTHDQLVAVIDAAAWLLDADEDYKATDLLDAVSTTDVGSELYTTLLDWKPPAVMPKKTAD